jgi:transposase
MAKRSKVELFEQIRRAAEFEELSIHALALRFGVHRRTVRQALTTAVPPPHHYPERAAPVLDAWKPIIDAWLEEDKSAPKKQRHTARRIFQRLVDEHGAQVSETTVRRYVAQTKGRQAIALPEVMIPQDHPLGYEAEVDFGQIGFRLNGELVEGWMFVMRLSASGKGFHRICGRSREPAIGDQQNSRR